MYAQQCCCPRGKSLSSRILEGQFSSPCPCPRPWSSSPCPCPCPRKFKSSKIFEDCIVSGEIAWNPSPGIFGIRWRSFAKPCGRIERIVGHSQAKHSIWRLTCTLWEGFLLTCDFGPVERVFCSALALFMRPHYARVSKKLLSELVMNADKG